MTPSTNVCSVEMGFTPVSRNTVQSAIKACACNAWMNLLNSRLEAAVSSIADQPSITSRSYSGRCRIAAEAAHWRDVGVSFRGVCFAAGFVFWG
jgi:hypothetical protein